MNENVKMHTSKFKKISNLEVSPMFQVQAVTGYDYFEIR